MWIYLWGPPLTHCSLFCGPKTHFCIMCETHSCHPSTLPSLDSAQSLMRQLTFLTHILCHLNRVLLRPQARSTLARKAGVRRAADSHRRWPQLQSATWGQRGRDHLFQEAAIQGIEGSPF